MSRTNGRDKAPHTKNPVFLISTGRTGTKYFSKFFSAHGAGVSSFHSTRLTRLINVLSNMHYSGLLSHNAMRAIWKFLKYREILSYDTRYIECNCYYYNLVKVIGDIFPNAKFIFVIRSPKSYITSHINWERQRLKSIIANRLVPYWQPMPYVEEIKGFTNDYYQRVQFYSEVWQRKNTCIMKSIEGNDNAITIKFEDAFDAEKGIDTLNGLMQWLDIPLIKAIDGSAIAAKENVSKSGKSEQWDERCAMIVKRDNSDLMELFGYDEWDSTIGS